MRPCFYETMLLKRLVSNFVPSLSFTTSSTETCVLKVGDVLRQSRNFSEQDVTEYLDVTHDLNPLHFDSKFARSCGLKIESFMGCLLLAYSLGLLLLIFQELYMFLKVFISKLPVYVDEEVEAQILALNIRGNRNKNIVKFSTKCFKDGELLAIEGEDVALLPAPSRIRGL
ncbi:hypothetical protein MKX01_027396 [Papaver californicum]|nr:hypothetical protein MKX01_027396 [Papaver californicum]